MTNFAAQFGQAISGAAVDAAFATLDGDASAAQAVIASISAQVRTLSDRFRDVIRLEDFLPAANDDVGAALNAAHAVAQPGDRITLRGATSYNWATPATLSKPGVSFQSGATFVIEGGITALTLAGQGNTVRDATFVGANQTQAGIVAGSCAISVSGVCCLAENLVVQWLDNLIVGPLGAGYCSTIRGIDARFAGSRIVWIEDGVGTTVEDLIYDSSFPTAVAGLHYQAQGGYFHNVDVIHAGGVAGLLIEPYTGTGYHGLYWTFFNTVEIDTCFNVPGILIRNDTPASGVGAITVQGMFFTACWSSTCLVGLMTSGTGYIDLVTLTGCQILNNTESAINNQAGGNIVLEACALVGNCSLIDQHVGTPYAIPGGPSPSPTVRHGAGGLMTLRGGRIAAVGANLVGNPTAHVERDTGAGTVFVDGFSIDIPPGSNWQVPFAVASDSAGHFVIGTILGYANRNSGEVSAPAGASSVTLPHGLSLTPNGASFQVTPLTAPSGMTGYYLDPASITSSQATIRIIGTTTAAVTFAWRASVDAI